MIKKWKILIRNCNTFNCGVYFDITETKAKKAGDIYPTYPISYPLNEMMEFIVD